MIFTAIRYTIITIVLLIALFGPVFSTLVLPDRSSQLGNVPFEQPSAEFILGLDSLGRDVLTSVLMGGQSLVITAVIAGSLTTLLGIGFGCLGALHPKAGFIVDAIADAVIIVPAVLVLLLVSVLFPNSGLSLLIVTCAIIGTPFAARVFQASAFKVVHSGYVQAARNTGSSSISILLRDIIPNISEIARSVWGLRIVEALYFLSIANFLGVGSGLGEFAWSTMVRENSGGILLNPYSVIAPAGMLAATSIVIMTVLRPGK